jgi:hypothetical protein
MKQRKTLLTVFTEAQLEDAILEEITKLGARGFSVTDARGKGTHGLRLGQWTKDANIRLEVVGDAALCQTIIAHLLKKYEKHYGLLIFTQEVDLEN